jgi:hypothetical protein
MLTSKTGTRPTPDVGVTGGMNVVGYPRDSAITRTGP